MAKLLGELLKVFLLFWLLSGCRKTGQGVAGRTYRMGFQNSAPRPDANLYLQSLNLWMQRADAAIISTEVPWDSLMAGEKPEVYITSQYKGLTDWYRAKNLKLWIYIDPENGLNRSADADALTQMGKSISQPGVQQVYRSFVLAMDSMLKPEHLGLALETNLIRAAAPGAIYMGVKQAANAAAVDVRKFDKNVLLSVSIQVDYAWGKLGNGSFLGIGQDFLDFSFIQELGFSSYPYFGFEKVNDIPLNYYSKLVEGKSIPVFVSEGGWTSRDIMDFSGRLISGTPLKQQDYLVRQGQLLDQVQANAVFQLTFTDIDLSSLPPTVPPSIKYFAYLGLVDSNLQPRASLSAWDNLFKRTLKPGN